MPILGQNPVPHSHRHKAAVAVACCKTCRPIKAHTCTLPCLAAIYQPCRVSRRHLAHPLSDPPSPRQPGKLESQKAAAAAKPDGLQNHDGLAPPGAMPPLIDPPCTSLQLILPSENWACFRRHGFRDPHSELLHEALFGQVMAAGRGTAGRGTARRRATLRAGTTRSVALACQGGTARRSVR